MKVVSALVLLLVGSASAQEDGPPECVAAQFGACGEDNDECSGALLCGGSMDRSACSDDENAAIEGNIASMCGGGDGPGDGPASDPTSMASVPGMDPVYMCLPDGSMNATYQAGLEAALPMVCALQTDEGSCSSQAICSYAGGACIVSDIDCIVGAMGIQCGCPTMESDMERGDFSSCQPGTSCGLALCVVNALNSLPPPLPPSPPSPPSRALLAILLFIPSATF